MNTLLNDNGDGTARLSILVDAMNGDELEVISTFKPKTLFKPDRLRDPYVFKERYDYDMYEIEGEARHIYDQALKKARIMMDDLWYRKIDKKYYPSNH